MLAFLGGITNEIVQEHGFERCMLDDNMHLSHNGHTVLANSVLTTIGFIREKSAFTVAIVGVGQLGSRHLQGLAKINIPIHIELVEPNPQSRSIAMMRLAEMEDNPHLITIRYCDSVSELSENLDLVIMATNADVRANLLNELLAGKQVRNLILEKVLFQDINDYDYFANIFLEKGIQVWVNHPRREFVFYDQFMADIRRSRFIDYHVQGVDWGLACNGLHFIDHLQYLTKDDGVDYSVAINNLIVSNGVEESKRKGCYEVFGTLMGTVGSHEFSLKSAKLEGVSPWALISILTDQIRLVVDEAKGRVMYAYPHDNWQWHECEAKIVEYQSELTGRVAQSILVDGSCRLPRYEEAVLAHKPFIVQLKNTIESSLDRQLEVCPIS